MATNGDVRRDPGRLLTTRVLPALIAIAIATGWTRWFATKHGWIDEWVGIAVTTVLCIGSFIGISFWTARKLRIAANDVRQAERNDIYRRVANSYPGSAVYVFDNDLRFVLADGSVGTSDFDLGALKGKTIWEALDPDVVAAIEPSYRAALAGETSSFELEVNKQVFNVIIAPLRDDAGEVEAGVVLTQQITSQKRLEEQLVQSQKMEAIGQLAGGVAHDFNNLLTAMRGYSALLQNSHLEDEQRGWANELVKASEYAASLTKQLVTLSRKQVLQPRSLDLNEVIRETNTLLARVITERVTVETVLDPMLRPVMFDPGYLNQVLVNLAVNARDAMPGGGRLLIETANVMVDDHFASEHLDLEPGDYVMVTVSDNGNGMSKETLAHIFEPFFTTKGEGKGTGLGLSTVYGIIKQSGGHISVYSELGEGTVFRLYFPPAREAAVAAKSAAPPTRPAKGVRVLVVDDDDSVRRIVGVMLTQHGHEAVLVANLNEALEACEGRAFDLVITDLVVPRSDGVEIASRLQELQPELSVLYTSGYTPETIQESLPQHADFLPKPFTVHELIETVNGLFVRQAA